MPINIKTLGQINGTHRQVVGRVWSKFDRLVSPIDRLTRLRNDENLAAILSMQTDPSVLILASGMCKEFRLTDVAAKASKVTLSDIRETALKKATRGLGRYGSRLEAVKADLSVVDFEYFDQVRTIIEGASTAQRAVRYLGDYLRVGVEFNRDPLNWYNQKADLVLLIGTMLPIMNNYFDWLIDQVVAKFGTYPINGPALLNPIEKIDLEKRVCQAFMRYLRERVIDGGMAYAVVYHQVKGSIDYPLPFYQQALTQGFEMVDGVLPHTIVDEDQKNKDLNFGLLLKAV